MFDWLFRKNKTLTRFADNRAAFAHACTMGYRYLLNALVPALVEKEGRRDPDGERCFLIRLAGENGGREIWGCTMADAPGFPEIGDLVAFRIVRIASELPEDASLIGYIACKLEPVLRGKNEWRIAVSYTPPNLKPELHM